MVPFDILADNVHVFSTDKMCWLLVVWGAVSYWICRCWDGNVCNSVARASALKLHAGKLLSNLVLVTELHIIMLVSLARLNEKCTNNKCLFWSLFPGVTKPSLVLVQILMALTRLRILVFLCNTCAVRTLSILKLYYTLPVSEVVTGELTVMLKAWFPSNFWQGKLNVCIAVFALV